MIFLYLLSFACFVALWWAYFGYFIFLGIARICKPVQKRVAEITEFPKISILICCRNEEGLIEQKVDNLLALDYPKDQLEIIFLDGCSTDETVSLLEDKIKNHGHIRVVETGLQGKIPQINSVLKDLDSEYVVNTDVDAEMQPDVLIELLKDFASDSYVGVAGAFVVPKDTCAEEVQYWRSQNKVRVLESEVYSSSIVIAPCYMFKRDLIQQFPEDVVADDIYIANLATVNNQRVTYCKSALVYELRSPQNIQELFVHKFRKTNAYITEVLRFMHYLPRLNLFWKIIYLTRTLQLLGTVWILLTFGLLLLALLSFGELLIVFLYAILGILSLGITHLVIGKTETKALDKVGNLFISARVFLVLTALLLLVGLSYIFYRQDSQYSKVS